MLVAHVSGNNLRASLDIFVPTNYLIAKAHKIEQLLLNPFVKSATKRTASNFAEKTKTLSLVFMI